MTETEINESIATILDAEQTGIITQQGTLKLRDILTAVHKAQASYAGIWYKLFGKPLVSPENVILHLPDKAGQYINMTEGGRYLGFYTQIIDALDTLEDLALLRTNHVLDLDEGGYSQRQYGVSSDGKAFVNYGEKIEKN